MQEVQGPAAEDSLRAFLLDPMNFERGVLNAVWTISTAALLCSAAGVSAQTVYQQVDAAGQVTFTDRVDTTRAPPEEPIAEPEVKKAPVRNSNISARRAAVIEANEAARRLREARLARARGAEPLPGERARGADAKAVNHRYWQRQEKLRQLTETALRRSNETETRRALYAGR